jgi:hypothetical protein
MSASVMHGSVRTCSDKFFLHIHLVCINSNKFVNYQLLFACPEHNFAEGSRGKSLIDTRYLCLYNYI